MSLATVKFPSKYSINNAFKWPIIDFKMEEKLVSTADLITYLQTIFE